MNENRKCFRNAEILLAAVCVVIGIVIVKQDGRELPEVISVSDAEEGQLSEEKLLGGELVDDNMETDAPELDKQCGGYRYKILEKALWRLLPMRAVKQRSLYQPIWKTGM